ncbi:asparagine synthase [Aureobasidium pullulans EXF-150]|uniref:Asparagine synthase n=1 Tax=Aureobasidium pullulans EXF-150 TaxID=1043002 RepID=A0A074XVL9_AURPU|nr:asparagine synthase [Aureobasidium pullulans EXF-150]KEQ78711.1 asparagine synthase [Aureobasidium pullulans EXF-150]
MCGISCILALQHSHHKLPELAQVKKAIPGVQTNGDADHTKLAAELDASLDQIKHRGPDSRGQWISNDKRVAFGHVRLAINDLSPDGIQPFHDNDRTVHAVVNGEFYDYDNIRKDLETKTDYKFRGRSDSELAIALYKYYGLNFLHHLRGEFACVIFDESQQLLIAARDRYGIKPLFWTIQEGRLLIAAEIKAFLPLGWKPEWDVKSLLDAGWNHDERTLFKGIAKVRPGHYLTCQSFDHIEQRPYWDISYPDKHAVDARTPEDMIQGVRERMLDAIKIRLRADVPVGIYLSGGIDSSVIAGMVTHLVKEQGISMGSANATDRVSCFSIAFDEESGFDESAIANRTAEWLGVRYIKKHMNEEELAKRFEDATWHCEHHNPDFNFVGKYALSEVPQELGFKVVLTGEGADENFAGYPLYLPDYLREHDFSWDKHNTLPESERENQLDLAEKAAVDYYTSVGADVSNRGPSVARRMLNDITTVSSMAAFQLDIFAPWAACYGKCDPQVTIANNADGRVRNLITDSWHPLHSAQYVWSKGHLANIFLTCLGDRTEMAHSIEARTPFLDHKLTEYVNHLPPSAKLRWEPEAKTFTEKWVLREASKPFITKELYERKKHPYSAPTTWPEGGPLNKLLDKLISEENIKQLGFVDWERCKGLTAKAFGKNGDPMAMRYAIVVAEWVILGQRFGVATAKKPEGW